MKTDRGSHAIPTSKHAEGLESDRGQLTRDEAAHVAALPFHFAHFAINRTDQTLREGLIAPAEVPTFSPIPLHSVFTPNLLALTSD